MSWFEEITCKVCQQKKTVVLNYITPDRDTCGDCEAEQKDNLRAKHFTDLEAMSIEARVQRLEKLLYIMAEEKHVNYRLRELIMGGNRDKM